MFCFVRYETTWPQLSIDLILDPGQISGIDEIPFLGWYASFSAKTTIASSGSTGMAKFLGRKGFYYLDLLD